MNRIHWTGSELWTGKAGPWAGERLKTVVSRGTRLADRQPRSPKTPGSCGTLNLLQSLLPLQALYPGHKECQFKLSG